MEARQLAALYKSDPESATVRAADALRQKPEAAVSHLDTDDVLTVQHCPDSKFLGAVFHLRHVSHSHRSAAPIRDAASR